MTLKQECPFCNKRTIAKRLVGFYVGSDERIKLWECRHCYGIWSKKLEEGA
jgi:ribosomal protein L37AE/L43A